MPTKPRHVSHVQLRSLIAPVPVLVITTTTQLKHAQSAKMLPLMNALSVRDMPSAVPASLAPQHSPRRSVLDVIGKASDGIMDPVRSVASSTR